MGAAVALSFAEWDLLTPATWVGLSNYTELISSPVFWKTLKNSIVFILGYLPIAYFLGLCAALALNNKFKGSSFLRAAYFLPVITSWVIVSLLWKWILNPQGGIVNSLLFEVGISGPGWWTSTTWAMPTVIIASVWKDFGYVMLILLAGLQSIPPEYEEAASIDGANRFQILRSITLPLLTPATFFVIVISLINNFQVFDQIYLMTDGGPEGSTSVLVQQIVKNSFAYGRMGYASAMSMVLFAIILSITLIQLKLQKRWVNYE
jgi:multiple sugar transport system permease protein